MTSIKMDPVTLAILKGRLEQIADEMDATLFRSAFNPIIAEAHDASHGIYDAQTGETLVQGKSGLPIFVGVMAFAVKAVIERVERDGGVADGDLFIFNDRLKQVFLSYKQALALLPYELDQAMLLQLV